MKKHQKRIKIDDGKGKNIIACRWCFFVWLQNHSSYTCLEDNIHDTGTPYTVEFVLNTPPSWFFWLLTRGGVFKAFFKKGDFSNVLKNDVRKSALNQGGGIYEGGGIRNELNGNECSEVKPLLQKKSHEQEILFGRSIAIQNDAYHKIKNAKRERAEKFKRPNMEIQKLYVTLYDVKHSGLKEIASQL